MDNLDMDDLLVEFLAETSESLEVIDAELIRFETDPNNKEILNKIFRLVHTIKGTCGFLSLPRLEAITHASETLLGKFRDGQIIVTSELVTLILESIDQIKNMVAHLETEYVEPEGDNISLISRLEEASEVLDQNHIELPVFKDDMATNLDSEDFDETDIADLDVDALDATLAKGALNRWDDALGRELRPGEVSLAELEQVFEDTATDNAFEPISDRQTISESKSPDTIADKDNSSSVKVKETSSANQSIRVNVDILEDLMTMVSELVLTRNQLMQMVRNMDDSEFKTPLQRLSSITAELQDSVMKTRMQPIGNAWKKLPRIVRDASHDLDKKIQLIMEGDQTELDRQVLELIKDPLTHMIRNSCDHGLEPMAERIAAGKSTSGTIRLRAYHEGGHIIIEVSDDGNGLNTDNIREKAIAKGLIDVNEAATMTEAQIHRLIFSPGFSTAAKVTNISGRGVGMDVVKTNIELIGGVVDVKSSKGRGTIFKIKIPLTLAIISALIVGTGEQRFALPQLSVVELVRTGPNCEHKIEMLSNAKVLRLRNQLLPLLPLSELLAFPEDDNINLEMRNAFVVVMQVGNHQFGIAVDQVYDTEEIVVKPLSNLLCNIPEYSGATILGDGSVIMILDPNGIAHSIGSLHEATNEKAAKVIEQAERKQLAEERVSLLIFSAYGHDLKACPLSFITRLEELDAKSFENTHNGIMIQYRGRLMPLIHMGGLELQGRQGRQPILVFSQGDQYIGLCVDSIIDIVEEPLNIQLSDVTPHTLGTAVLRGKATEIIDVSYYLGQANEQWLTNLDEKTSQEKGRILLHEPHPFFRNMLIAILNANNFDVTQACSADEVLDYLKNGQEFDIILSDIDNKAEIAILIDQLKVSNEWADLPWIALSAQSGQADGIFRYCIKKSDRKMLLHTLKEAMSNPEGIAA